MYREATFFRTTSSSSELDISLKSLSSSSSAPFVFSLTPRLAALSADPLVSGARLLVKRPNFLFSSSSSCVDRGGNKKVHTKLSKRKARPSMHTIDAPSPVVSYRFERQKVSALEFQMAHFSTTRAGTALVVRCGASPRDLGQSHERTLVLICIACGLHRLDFVLLSSIGVVADGSLPDAGGLQARAHAHPVVPRHLHSSCGCRHGGWRCCLAGLLVAWLRAQLSSPLAPPPALGTTLAAVGRRRGKLCLGHQALLSKQASKQASTYAIALT